MQPQVSTPDKNRFIAAVRKRIEDPLGTALADTPPPGHEEIRELLRQLDVAASRVGKLPPQPPTFRARVGSALVRIVQRLLFWYTPQIANDAIERRLVQLSQALNVELEAAAPDMTARRKRAMDQLYLAFEDTFRGTQEQITQRLSVYLPYLKEVNAGGPERPVLDIGCGRGEWLRILRGAGLHGEGVDNSPAMAAMCRREDLNVTEADVVAFLKGRPPGAYGAATALHIVEHLPLEVIVETLEEIKRVLCPGGIVIFETPNPDNVLVGSKNFYFDMSHRNPIPSLTLEFLFRRAGFGEVRTLPLNPCEPWIRVAEDGSEVARRFNEYFFGPQDYAVIGKKI